MGHKTETSTSVWIGELAKFKVDRLSTGGVLVRIEGEEGLACALHFLDGEVRLRELRDHLSAHLGDDDGEAPARTTEALNDRRPVVLVIPPDGVVKLGEAELNALAKGEALEVGGLTLVARSH